jgi:hypothetical protein
VARRLSGRVRPTLRRSLRRFSGRSGAQTCRIAPMQLWPVHNACLGLLGIVAFDRGAQTISSIEPTASGVPASSKQSIAEFARMQMGRHLDCDEGL